jgi:hypothetical protein
MAITSVFEEEMFDFLRNLAKKNSISIQKAGHRTANAYLHGRQERTPFMDEFGEGAVWPTFVYFT